METWTTTDEHEVTRLALKLDLASIGWEPDDDWYIELDRDGYNFRHASGVDETVKTLEDVVDAIGQHCKRLGVDTPNELWVFHSEIDRSSLYAIVWC